ncbi:protein toll-like [Lucilia sericata]|uniref:protein toll-like n=1 Tax=Lucilia sericata TaxID=13632 RepID=UPI0018A87FB6|nr:protein toll-like [Lucilia sericata]
MFNFSTFFRNLFKKLDKLQSLDLSHNQLNSYFRIALEKNTNLNYLYLQNNSIPDLFILHIKLPRYLRELDLSFNEIYELKGKNLELLYTNDLTLNLSHNRIQTIQLEDFGEYNLLDTLSVRTDLNHNPLQCDCKILKSMEYLLNGYKTHLKFNIENLNCWGPKQLNGKYLNDVKKMELLCSLQPQYVGSYKCPEECECWIRLYDKILLMNCSHRNLTQVPIIKSIRNYLNGIELNLSGNLITTLPSSLQQGYAECTKLFLYQNNLSEINKSQIPLNLTHLDLRRNQLQLLDEDTLTYLNANRFLHTIYLSSNKWKCDCSDTSVFLSNTIQSNRSKFVDGSKVACHNYSKIQVIQDLKVLCHKKNILNIVMICMCITIIFIILTLYYKYRTKIKIFLYSHNICRSIVAKYDDVDDVNKRYDAFISYSHKDEDFIANYLVPELENGCPSFKLCVHVRDFVIGDYIPDQIVKSIADSRRIIVVLSNNFIESEWAKMEFKEAYRATLTERRAKIIPIMYKDIGELANLDKELRLYLKMNTYLKWEDPWFWQKLRFAMPHKK